MLELKNYSNFILKDISFLLKNNENLLILGENGAGKSTLAKVLSSIISSNNLFFNEKNISKLSGIQRAKLINYIPSSFEIFDDYMTVLEYLKLSIVENRSDEQIENIINILKINHIKNSSCSSLSSGEKQLVLLASAILHDAKITIFDELMANLDIKRLRDVFLILNSNYLKQKIIITHNLDFAYALKNYKVLYLEAGVLKFYGDHEEFFCKERLKEFYNDSLRFENSHLVVDL
ncbi:ABC transporter ATP-binding protein [Aliarcobacter skirrowii]|uniref:ABC transporter ATP-binding protein n=1 Tax=Aliarcobacter skirrowii CCUG 10374 TaxID=1032239 RepID=A0AAD0SLT1_9BACT|nr:ABC transporter ATP-binding protein [Aliarcobacter skirrowii]AXX85013.1 iron siderophore ABC transporter, ATP-binding protein [Aliarcobacter skirrowii CCUG 10374]KAB0620825.1 ABC transporter ATP-binding protein [Aliarcobacter skirrowii CCUG 10374]RXI25831.1 ABC transporter ATP-binding protein [Aliarcobacter skirrowii CCUG 10374]SUU96464.1 Lipoprotein-releasing system ATP-binding protein LolD [Aliarcobacter skirrowii]